MNELPIMKYHLNESISQYNKIIRKFNKDIDNNKIITDNKEYKAFIENVKNSLKKLKTATALYEEDKNIHNEAGDVLIYAVSNLHLELSRTKKSAEKLKYRIDLQI